MFNRASVFSAIDFVWAKREIIATEMIGEREIGTEMGKREIGTEMGERDGDYDSDDDMVAHSIMIGLQYFQSMVNLAIDFYNKDKAEKEKYSVVELIKLFGVAGAGDY
ncbi:hypothetical protein ABFS83_06G141100 [Erythranthe nasuta]